MVQFLSINFFLGFLQFLLGFSKVPLFCVTLYLVSSATGLPTNFSPLLSLRKLSKFAFAVACSSSNHTDQNSSKLYFKCRLHKINFPNHKILPCMNVVCSYYNAVIHDRTWCRQTALIEWTVICRVHQLQSRFSFPGPHPLSKMTYCLPW